MVAIAKSRRKCPGTWVEMTVEDSDNDDEERDPDMRHDPVESGMEWILMEVSQSQSGAHTYKKKKHYPTTS